MTIREVGPEAVEVTLKSARAVMWSSGIGVSGMMMALFGVESWWTSLVIVSVCAAAIVIIGARAVTHVHTIDRPAGRITIVSRQSRRQLSQRVIDLRFVNDLVLDRSTKTKKPLGDARSYDVPVYRSAYQLQDGTRVAWHDDYMEYDDTDFGVIDRVRLTLGLPPRSDPSPSSP